MLNHILLPLDGSSLAECVLPHAVAIAQAWRSKIVLLHVLEPADISSISLYANPYDWRVGKYQAHDYLNNLAESLNKAGLEVEVCVVEGKPAENILTFSGAYPDSLILLSSHGRSGLNDWTTSSIAQKVAMRARVSVMVIPAYQPCSGEITGLRYRRILVPVDGSRRAEYSLPFANAIAHAHGSEILLVHVLSCPEMPCRGSLNQDEIDWVNRIMERNREEAWNYLTGIQSWLQVDTKVQILLFTGNSVPARLHAAAEQYQADLILLNGHGYSGSSDRPYGSVTLHFLLYGNKPRLVIQDFPTDQIELTQAEFLSSTNVGGSRNLYTLA